MRTGGLARGTDGAQTSRFRFQADSRALLTAALGGTTPLPPLRPAPGPELTIDDPALPEAPAWSPLAVARPLFAVVWMCFGLIAATVEVPPVARVAGLADLLATSAGIVALVLVTLSVAHVQISGLRPRPAAIAVVVLGLGQGALAGVIAADGHRDFWGVAAWVFVLVGLAVPLVWVAGQFQSGVRRHRVESHLSLTNFRIERARRQAHQTVQSVHRHDVRSMLFVIDGAARTLSDGSLSAEQRAGFSEMLAEGVQRLGALMDVRSEEIQPFAVDGVARAVVHAERKAGRQISAELMPGLNALGRAADVAAGLRTLVTLTGRHSATGVQVRSELIDGAIVVRVEPAGDEAQPAPLSIGSWEEVWPESFKPFRQNDDESVDLYVVARLLAEQGADLWTMPSQRTHFAIRMPAAADSDPREGA